MRLRELSRSMKVLVAVLAAGCGDTPREVTSDGGPLLELGGPPASSDGAVNQPLDAEAAAADAPPASRKDGAPGVQSDAATASKADGLPPPPSTWFEGFGSKTRGGRGGQILRVKNLKASGADSLQAALQASGPRIVVFEVSGQINLGASPLSISNPYITIAGQTAPSPGITIQGGLRIQTSEVILQHLRIRAGASGPKDVVQVLGAASASSAVHNIVVDHCSISWPNGDESFSTVYHVRDVTVSNCLLSETTHGATGAFLVGNWTSNLTMLRNLLVHNNARTPRIDYAASVAAVNNLSYNSASAMFMVGAPGGGTLLSAVGNQRLVGPSTPSGKYFIAAIAEITGTNKLYAADSLYTGGYVNSVAQAYLVNTPPVAYSNVSVMKASAVESYLVARAGARPADRDPVDARVVGDLKKRSGSIISSETAVGGFPTLAQNTRAFDPGPDPNGDDDGDGLSNVEEVLQAMAAQLEGTP